jgi:hypothetical protein
MRRVDAAAFAITAFSVLVVNAVAAVAIGCFCYLLRHPWRRLRPALGLKGEIRQESEAVR